MNPTANDNNVCMTLLATHNKGRVANEINESYRDLILAVRRHGKPGKLNLSIEVKPATGSDASRIEFSITVASKVPVTAPVVGIYYTTEEGGTQKTDPEQEDFPAVLRALDKDAPPAAAPEPAAQPAG